MLVLKICQVAEFQVDKQADRLTRRSAGLPAMIASILSPEDDASFRIFVENFIVRSHVHKDEPISKHGRLSLPQVHTMNTLREVMINSRFRNAIVPHVQRLLVLATENLGSSIWAIQNCGLMLYRACLLRLPSGDSSELQDHEIFNREKDIPTALNLALDLLQTRSRLGNSVITGQDLNTNGAHEDEHDITLTGVEQKFAALDMIAHLNPMSGQQHDLHGHLIELLNSSVWLIRQRAAEVLAFLTPREEILEAFRECFNLMEMNWRQNRLHGTLLYCRELLGRYFSITSEVIILTRIAQLARDVSLVSQRFSTTLCAPPVMAILLDITNDVIEQSLSTAVPISLSLIKCEEVYSAVSKLQDYYLVDRSFVYNVALNLLIASNQNSDKDKLLLVLVDSIQDNPDIARYVLERLLRRRLAFRPEELFQFNCLFSPQTPTDVSSLAIDMVSLSVGKYPLYWNASAVYQALTFLAPLGRTREVRTSRMLAQGVLFSLVESHCDDQNDLGIRGSRYYHSWEYEVQSAAREETDAHARFQAAKAISAYLPSLLDMKDASYSVGLLLTLRDLVSDDDEEVRWSAAQSASSILSNHDGSLRTGPLAEGYCAPTAMAQLENYIRSLVAKGSIQHEVLLRRLLNAGTDVDLELFLRESSAQKQLAAIDVESTALFAVERQNLYIDEVHEIRFSCSLCRANKLDYSVRPTGAIESAIGEWAADGLEELLTLLETEKDDEMIPNETFDLEVLLLCMRVVCAAGSYLSLAWTELEPNLTYRTILRRLYKLREIASQGCLNSEIACSIDYNLEVVAK